MARFRGTVSGNRGTASRLGHPQDGLTVTANGWNSGVHVDLYDEDGEDRCRIYFTGGSNGGGQVLVYDGPCAIADAARLKATNR